MADDAPEVDTDEELEVERFEGGASGHEIVAEVDTDEDLKRAQASSASDRTAYCLWGAYQSARIKTVQQGMYHVRFDDGATRWTTCTELVLPDQKVPLSWLQPGAPILVPEADNTAIDFATPASTARRGSSTPRVKTTRQLTNTQYMQGVLVRRAEGGSGASEQWEVRRDDADGTLSTHAADALRLPVAHGGVLGGGGRVNSGGKVYALRGEWRKATLHGGGPGSSGSRSRGRHVSLELGDPNGSKRDVWVTGGQLLLDEPADAAALPPGTRCVAYVPSRQLRPHVEGAVLGFDETGESAEIVADDGKQLSVPVANLRTRVDASFRVLCASGGFQRATVVTVTPDGMYCCRLLGGAERWVSATELTSASHTAAGYDAASAHPLQPGACVAIAPEGGVRAGTRWVSGGLVVSPAQGAANQKGCVTLRRPHTQKPNTLKITRRDGRFGIGLDENNRVVDLKEGCSAKDAGVQLGDRICRVDGVPIASAEDLARACAGKESVELAVSVEADGGAATDDVDGDGIVDDGMESQTYVYPLERVLLPLLAGGVPSPHAVSLGDDVFVAVGGWREALVEVQENGRYLLHHGKGEKRWADGGEIAWHDIAPMPFDVAEGRPMLGWDASRDGGTSAAFHPALVNQQEGAGFGVTFDHGDSTKLALGDLRERWTLPMRVLGFYGDYLQCSVLESLGGILRVDFGGSIGPRWALPDEVLYDPPPDPEDPIGLAHQYPGCHLAVLDSWKEVLAGGSPEGMLWKRATYVTDRGGGKVEIEREASGKREVVPLGALRRPRRPEENVGLADSSSIIAMCGEWLPGTLLEISDDDCADAGRRVGASIRVDSIRSGQIVTTTLSRRSLVTLDMGAQQQQALTKLRRGSPIVVWHEGMWQNALIIQWKPGADGGQGQLMSAAGVQIEPGFKDVRARLGEVHPVEYCRQLNDKRVERFQVFQIMMLQKAWRALKGRRTAQDKRNALWAAMQLQARFRVVLATAKLKRLRREAAALKIQTAYRRHRARGVLRALQTAALQQKMALKIQTAWRRHRARKLLAALKLAAAKAAEDQKDFEARTAAAIVIEAGERGRRARAAARAIRKANAATEAEKRDAAATVIQSHERGHVARAEATKRRAAKAAKQALEVQSATVIQAHQRGHAARVEARGLRQDAAAREAAAEEARARVAAATVIESHGRGMNARRERGRLAEGKQRNDAATVIQKHARGKWARFELKRLQEEAAELAAQRDVSATVIEAHGRGMLARRERRRLRMERDRDGAATLIQASQRGHVARVERLRLRNERDKDSATRIQKHERTRAARKRYAAMRRAAITIEAHQRGHMARVERLRLRNERDKDSATRIQKHERTRAARKRYLAARRAAITIEAHQRGHIARSEANARRVRRDAEKIAATRIQSYARMRAARTRYVTARTAIVTIQRYARGKLARNELHRRATDKGERLGATTIQKHARGKRARRRYAAARAAAIRVQTAQRRHAAVSAYHTAYAHVAWVQAHVRTFIALARYRDARRRVIRVQTEERRWAAERLRSRGIASAVVLQKYGRRMLANRAKKRLRRRRDARSLVLTSVVQLQAYARGMNARREKVRLREARASAKLQARTRGILARNRFGPRVVKPAVTAIQSAARRRAARNAYTSARGAATRLQAHARGKAGRTNLRTARGAADTLSAHGRGLNARRERVKRLRSIGTVQRLWRAAHRRRNLQAAAAAGRRAAVFIQRIARGRARRAEFAQKRAERRAALARAAEEAIAAKAAKHTLDHERLTRGLARTDAASVRLSHASGPPDVMALYLASSSELAGARRRRMPKDTPTSPDIVPRLAELDPRTALAAEAREKAAYAADPNNFYDHTLTARDPKLLGLLASMPYKGGGKAARRGKYANLLASGSP